jgi:hypothetical protein
MPDRTLTEADIAAIVEAMHVKQQCSCPFTTEEYTLMKRFVRVFNGAANAVGVIILTAFVGGIIALLTKGFWVTASQKIIMR